MREKQRDNKEKKQKENKEKKQKNNKNRDNDNVIYVGGSREARKNNEDIARKRNIRTKIMVALLLIVIIAGAALFFDALVNKKYKGYRVINSTETNYENTASYIQFSGNLLKYTPDGVSYINRNGDTVWSAGINMKMPIAVARGNYAVVADLNGNAISVFSNEGQVSSLTMPYTICDVDVAKQGAFAVVLESDKTNYIKLYDKNGKDIYELQTTIDKSGYPIDIAISEDGKKLFTSYINMNGTTITNNLAAYNFGDVGQNANADRMVGGYMFDTQVIPKVSFVSNDTVVAFGTNEINIYAMKEKPGEKAKLKFDVEIQSVFYSEKYIGVIVKNDDNNGDYLYKVKVYDLKGKQKFDYNLDFAYDNIYAGKNEFIISGGSDVLIMRKNGNVKYRGSMTGRVINMVPTGNRLEYVVTYDNATEIIKLKSEGNAEVE
ncbi:MAG: hypothetical protein J6P57_02575 [Lachnospiraceae bacterium]|nr:hypothetical protein [Lachnospiraceae bacterium]